MMKCRYNCDLSHPVTWLSPVICVDYLGWYLTTIGPDYVYDHLGQYSYGYQCY